MRSVIVGVVILTLTAVTSACFNNCIREFNTAMDPTAVESNMTTKTDTYCSAMRAQLDCFSAVMPNCLPQQRIVINSMTTMFIKPDFQRTCAGMMRRPNSAAPVVPSRTPGQMNPTALYGSMARGMSRGGRRWPPQFNPQLLIFCNTRMTECKNVFNMTFSDNMKDYNVTGMCKSLEQLTLCFVSLLSSDCSSFVSKDVVSKIQQQYGSRICSQQAQDNTATMLECTNKTFTCFKTFDDKFKPAVRDYNLKNMCGSIHNYSDCLVDVSQKRECAPYTTSSLSGMAAIKNKNNALCGDDQGKSAHECVESFQDCYLPFNTTFFPAVRASNLSLLCTSLKYYTSCVMRIGAKCNAQLGKAIESAAALRQQYSMKCHPTLVKLAECQEVLTCSKRFLTGVAIDNSARDGFCSNLGAYFPCVEKGLDDCALAKDITEVEFGDLGPVMTNYCDNISRNSKLLQCKAFVKCNTAVLMTFTPDIKNMYEGSTWCTFLQLSIGCAEHALQSSGCSLDGDVELERRIMGLDASRLRICEKDTGFFVNDEDNMVYQQMKKGEDKGDKGKGSTISSSGYTIISMVIVLLAVSGCKE